MTAVLEPAVLPMSLRLPTKPRRQMVLCPTCRSPVAGLLTECHRPACVAADIHVDTLFDRFHNDI